MLIKTNKTIIALSLAMAFSAQANELSEIEKKPAQNSSQAKAKDDVEKISVTGSRIKRDSFSVPTPIASIDKDAFTDAGLGSLAEILTDEMPQFGMANSNSNTQGSVQNTGLSTIDLRELGTNRTLTLIDGRRVVSNSYSGNYVSLSTIPKSMVERVEIITGGASATYGSDAIAGVVNIITQQDKEGTSFSAQTGRSVEGGGREVTFNFDHGGTYDDGKGYFFFSSTYDEQFGLTYFDRERAQQQALWTYDDDRMCNAMLTSTYDAEQKSAFQCIRDISKEDWRSLSDSTLGGVFDEKSSFRPDAGFWYDGQTLRDDWHEERYGVDFQQYLNLKIPDKQLSAAFKTEYEFDGDIQGYFQVHFSRTNSHNVRSPESEDECDSIVTHDPSTGVFGSDCIGRIPYDNPYMPEEIRAQASSKGVKWDRQFAEVGPVTNDNERTTIRTWSGLRGYLGDWEWDVSVGFGTFEQNQNRKNELYVERVRQGLNAEVLEDGKVQCKDEAARAAGCVPVNLFGEGAISAAAADYIRANPTINTEIDQTIVTGFITGDLFELPAGTASSAFGFEYRKDTQSVDTNVPNGGITFNYVPTFEGDVSVYEAFGEVSMPLLIDAPFAKSLVAEVSARIADYSWATTGLIQSYKAGFIYEPIAGYSIRANWARSMRAPTITELMSPPRGDYDSFSDICDDVTATSTGLGHSSCRQDPGIAATIAQEGVFEAEHSGYSPNAGNEELFEETSDTYTLGISIAPEFLEGFRMAVDFYDIRVEDAITSLSNSDILEFCYGSSMPYGNDNQFCNDIKRDEEGQLMEVKQRLINTDELRSKGYDIAMEYVTEIENFGSLKFKLDWAHVIENSVESTGPDGKFMTYSEGYLFNDVFEDKGSASITWRNDDLRIRWSTRYKGSIQRSRRTLENWQADIEANAARCSAGESSCIANPEPLWGHYLPSVMTHNLSASYTMDLAGDKTLTINGGINNLFDEHGPFIHGGYGKFDSAYGGGLGRFAFIGAKIQF